VTERNQVNAVARKHLAPYGLWRRCEHSFEAGWADCYYVLCGRQGWLECKLIPGAPFTIEQLLWGEQEVAAGGRWHLLAKRADEWLLLNVMQARLWYETGMLTGVVQERGKFPTRTILKELTR